MKLLLKAGSGGERHFAFLYSEAVSFPPNVHDMKAYYVTKELLRRGMRVTWLTLGDNFKVQTKNGITFVMIPRLARRFEKMSFWIRTGMVVAFCKITSVSAAYVDEWLFFRGDPNKFLVYETALKKAGVRFILDQRDPFIDYEISCGKLEPDSPIYKVLVSRYQNIYRLSDLVIVPSHRYERVMIEAEGLPPNKVLGTFRGIDSSLFKPDVKPLDLGSRLEKKFIIGWFGIMHPYRQIREVLVPLIKTIGDHIQEAHMVIGGEGPEIREFTNLKETYSEWFSILGFVPYSELPRYIAACDVLLCPVNTRFRFSRSSLWLKIFETLAVGRPIVTTRTDVSNDDASRLKGVIWVDGDFDSYLQALINVHSDYQTYRAQALEQSKHFEEYTLSKTMPRIVDAILARVKK